MTDIEMFSQLANEVREVIIFKYLDERNLEIVDKGSQLKLVKKCQGFVREIEDLKRNQSTENEDNRRKMSLEIINSMGFILTTVSPGAVEKEKALMIINIELDKLLPKTTISMPKVDCNNER